MSDKDITAEIVWVDQGMGHGHVRLLVREDGKEIDGMSVPSDAHFKAIEDIIKQYFNRHHIWCNKDPRKLASDCKMCKDFNEKYPMDGKTPDELLSEHFPDATAIPKSLGE